jgi:two-component system sensor histidine kinase KdpD
VDVQEASTDVGDLIDAAVASLGPRAQSVAVEAHPRLPRVTADPVLLERAVANLVDNALIHAAGVGLRVEAGTVAGRVDIRVIDRGPGIRREDRETIFRPFQRLGDSDNQAGVGLGLAVARGFVEAVGGDLDVEDTPGGGCTMVIRLSRVVGDPAPAPLPAESEPDPSGRGEGSGLPSATDSPAPAP